MSQSISCRWIEYSCDAKPTVSGFCIKHHDRGTLLEEAKTKGIRICDDGKRTCKNITQNDKLRCEECLTKIREKENKERKQRKEVGNICLDCGKQIEKPIEGVKGDKIIKCEGCYQNSRKVEENRDRSDRDYALENRLNPTKVLHSYMRKAASKNRAFEISKEKFIELLLGDCSYCGNKCDVTKVQGVDRINSDCSYVEGNTTTACSVCNYMKRDMTKRNFAEAVAHVYQHFAKPYLEENKEDEENITETGESYSFKPAQINKLYTEGKLNDFISICETDGRSKIFIDKLKDACGTTMNSIEFSSYLKYALASEVNTRILTETQERRRIPFKEIYGLIENKKPNTAAKLYVKVHGPTKDISKDFKELASIWNKLNDTERLQHLKVVLIKYNNARANRKDGNIEDENISDDENIAEVQSAPRPVKDEKEVIQWKISNIWSAFQAGKENNYKTDLENDQVIKGIEGWETYWRRFSETIKSSNKETAEPIIKKFIETLRMKRQQQMPSQQIDRFREDKEIWKSEDVVRAFKEEKIALFKAFIEKKNEEDTESIYWKKSWDTFEKNLREAEDSAKKKVVSNFMAAQRTKRNRRGKLAVS